MASCTVGIVVGIIVVGVGVGIVVGGTYVPHTEISVVYWEMAPYASVTVELHGKYP